MSLIYSRFDQETLDREYSPSSCVDDIELYLEKYAQLSETAKYRAQRNGSCEPDLHYGSGTEETLDLFLPDHHRRAPLQIFIHGGFWQQLSKEESCFAAPMFQSNGSYFAAINYTLAPQQTLTGIVDENRRAIVWLYSVADKLGFDRDQIYVSGSSAGAHIAMMLLVTDWKSFGLPKDVIKGVCAISGVYDLEPVRHTYVNDAVCMDASEAAHNSPTKRDLLNNCPVILTYGSNETSEFKRQTDDYRLLLDKTGIDITHREIADRNHFDIVLDLTDSDTWLSRQTLRQMGLGRPESANRRSMDTTIDST